MTSTSDLDLPRTISDVFAQDHLERSSLRNVKFIVADNSRDAPALNDGELSALVQDGVLTHVMGSLYADAPLSTPVLKAQALEQISDSRWGKNPIFCRWSAAWVYGAVVAPTIIEFMSDVYVNPFKENSQQPYRNHQSGLDPEKFWNVGSVKVVSPAQCAAELLVYVGEPSARVAAASIIFRGIDTQRLFRDTMEAVSTIGKSGQRRRARAILDQWASWQLS